MEVSIPDIETQKEISKHFVAIDDKIDLNNSMIAKFEEYIEAIYTCIILVWLRQELLSVKTTCPR